MNFGVTMDRNPEHHPTNSTEPAAAACCNGEFGGRSKLRSVLSRVGLHANTAQEDLLLELIHRSHRQNQSEHV